MLGERIERKLKRNSEDAIAYVYLASALAGIGRSREAVNRGRRAIDLMSIGRDSIYGANVLKKVAESYVTAGELELAIDGLTVLSSVPSLISGHLLRIWPGFASLRNHARFEAVVEQCQKLPGDLKPLNSSGKRSESGHNTA